MTQSDHKATKSGKGGEKGSVFFMAGEKPAVIAKPGDRAFDDPAFSIAAQWPAVLSDGVGSAIGAVRGDHLDAEFGEGLIQSIAVVSLVPDEALGLNFLIRKTQGLLHHGRFAHACRVDGKSQRNSFGINDQLQFCSLALARQSNSFSSALGRREGGINKTFLQINPTLLDQVADDGGKDLTEDVRTTPRFEVIVDRAFGRESPRQMLPLNARMQNKENRFKNFSLTCTRTPIFALARPLQKRPQHLPLIITYEHPKSQQSSCRFRVFG